MASPEWSSPTPLSSAASASAASASTLHGAGQAASEPIQLSTTSEKIKRYAPALITGAVLALAAIVASAALIGLGVVTFPVSAVLAIIALAVGCVALTAIGIYTLKSYANAAKESRNQVQSQDNKTVNQADSPPAGPSPAAAREVLNNAAEGAQPVPVQTFQIEEFEAHKLRILDEAQKEAFFSLAKRLVRVEAVLVHEVARIPFPSVDYEMSLIAVDIGKYATQYGKQDLLGVTLLKKREKEWEEKLIGLKRAAGLPVY